MKKSLLLIFGVLVFLFIVFQFVSENKKNVLSNNLQTKKEGAISDLWVVKFKDNAYLNFFPARVYDDYSKTGNTYASYSDRPLSEQGEIYPLKDGYYLVYGVYLPKGVSYVLVNLKSVEDVGNYLTELPKTNDESKLVRNPFAKWYNCGKINSGITEGVMPENYPKLYFDLMEKGELDAKCKVVY